MPLNSHSYLVAQGWKGTGKALREGAINRPVVIAQKKTLAGVGRDRDEAFPFWDHVFTVTATSINVKLCNDDDNESVDTLPSGSSTPLDRTSTGILSNKPKKVGLSVLETPTALQSTRLSIVALAKREAARRALYSRFFRGPALSPDAETGVPLVPGSSLFRTEGSESENNASPIRRGGNEKRKYQEEDGGTGVAQKKRKSKNERESKDEKKERRKLKRLKKQTEKGMASGVRVDNDAETGLAKASATSESLVQGGSGAGHFQKKDRKRKRRKVKVEESVGPP